MIPFIDDEEKMRDFKELTKEEFLQTYSYLTEEEYDMTEKEYKQKQIYYYDIWDGCKGIIIANDYEEAKKIFKEEFGDDIPIHGEDVDDYGSGICDISNVGVYEGNSELYVTE